MFKTPRCSIHHRSSSCERGERRRKRPRPSFASAPASLQAGWPAREHGQKSLSSELSASIHASGNRTAHAHEPGQHTDVAAGEAALPAAGDASMTFSLEPAHRPFGLGSSHARLERHRRGATCLTGASGAAGCHVAAACARLGCWRPQPASLAGCPCAAACLLRPATFNAPEKHQCSTHPIVMSDTGEASSSGAHGGRPCVRAASAGTAEAAGCAELPPPSLPGSGPGPELQRKSKEPWLQGVPEPVCNFACDTQPSGCICAPAASRLRR